MNIVNLTASTVLVPTSLGPWLAEPAARPAYPAPGTLYVVELEKLDDMNAMWAPVCIACDRGQIRRARTCAFAF